MAARSLAIRVFIVLISCFLCACGSGAEQDKSASSASGSQSAQTESDAQGGQASAQIPSSPEQGGMLVRGLIGEPSNLLSPLASDSASMEVTSMLYVSLVRYNKDIELEPYAAKSYEVLDGGKRLRFVLRQGILWQDGQELTADDVEFTWRMMVDPKTPTAYSENYKRVKEFRKIDRYTFEIVYDKPFAKALVSWAMDIMPKHILQGENLMNTRYSRNPVGAGPFVLKEWKAGQSLVLAANPQYFLGRPHLDGIAFKIIPDSAAMFLELESQNLDYMGLSPQQYLFQTKGPSWEQNFKKFKYLSFGYNFVGWNFKKKLFQDKRVRQALAYGVNTDAVIKGVYMGFAEPTVGPYKPGTWVYNTKLKPYPYDVAKAKALLAEAGWTDSDGDGVLDKDGKPFSFTILTNQGNEQRIKIATIVQANLKDLGIVVKMRTVEWAAFLKQFLDTANFDAVVMGWTIPQDPDIYNVWHSSKAVVGGLNFIRYSNPQLDELVAKGRDLMDQAERKAVYDRAQEILYEEQPYLFLCVPQALPVVSSRFQNVSTAPAGISHNLEWWWVPKMMQRHTLEP